MTSPVCNEAEQGSWDLVINLDGKLGVSQAKQTNRSIFLHFMLDHRGCTNMWGNISVMILSYNILGACSSSSLLPYRV